jgi:hypothetical protein
MKNLILGALLLLSTVFVGCTKDDKVYELTFSANHGITQENQFCNPYGYYSWTVYDKNYNSKYDESGYVVRETLTGTTTAKKGDWIYIYISVNDVFDYGSVSCKSSDGTVFMSAYTDNLYIDDSDSEDLKSINVVNQNGKDTTIIVKEIKFRI